MMDLNSALELDNNNINIKKEIELINKIVEKRKKEFKDKIVKYL